MGADGDINIYDWDAMVAQLGKEEACKYLNAATHGYLYTIFGRNVFIAYWSTEMWSDRFQPEKEDELKEFLIDNWQVWT